MKNFIEMPITVGNQTWHTYKCLIDTNSDIFRHVKQQARLKSQFTMNASQSGSSRSQAVKYESQLRGCLAEAFSKLLIEEYSKEKKQPVEVIRYDDVRTDGFKSPEGEYDIKVITPTNSNLLEARSSIAHNRSLANGIANFDIIGYYSSIAKRGESPNDYYIRPLFEYIDYTKKDFYRHGLESLIDREKVFLHFVGGTDIKTLETQGYDKSMGQGYTQYRVIKILNGSTIQDFLDAIIK